MKIPQEIFEQLMVKVVNSGQASELFAIPGVWDIVSTDSDYVQWVEEEYVKQYVGTAHS